MARDAFEYDVGGLLRDRYGRRQMAVTLKHTTPASTDTGRGYAPTDADGREQIVLVGSDGRDYFTQGAVNVKDYGARGDGVTDDTVAINNAIKAAFGTGIAQAATVGNAVLFPTGTYIGAGIIARAGVSLHGVALGGQVFSDTDASIPPSGSFLKLKAGSALPLITTDNFAALDASPASATAQNTPTRFGLYDLVLDGNRFGGATGRCLALFGTDIHIERVIVQNSAAAEQIYINGPTSSVWETELMMSFFRVENGVNNGINYQGDHDMLVSHGIVNNNGGLGLIEGPNLGTSQFSNIHIYSSGSYNWQLGSLNCSHVNCVSDGSGVQVLNSGISWIGGSIYGVRNQFDELICLGDGTTRRVQGLYFNTNMFQLGPGARMFRIRANTTTGWNFFHSSGNLGDSPSLPHFASDGYGTASGPIGSAATSITIASVKTAFTTGQIVVSDGVSAVTATVSTITGGGTILNLSGALGTAMAAGTNNIAVWNTAATPFDTFELNDTNGGSTGFFQTIGHPSGTTSRVMFDSMLMVGRLQLPNGLGAAPGPAVYASAGAPSNSAGNNLDWNLGGDGHIYFKSAGAWVLKV